MMHNGRPVVLASTMRPDHLNLRPGEVRAVVCPDCRRVRRLTRGMICAHSDERRADRGVWARCPGSGQRIRVDLTPGAWAGALADQREAWAASGVDPDTRAPALLDKSHGGTQQPQTGHASPRPGGASRTPLPKGDKK
jgi:hypothetical protein